MLKTTNRWIRYTFLAALCGGRFAVAAGTDFTGTLDVDVNKPGVTIPAMFYGLMTEEINHSYDGGLLAELIQNRTFQDPAPRGRGASTLPVHWTVIGEGKASIDRENPVNPALPVSLRLELGTGTCGVANDGYWGVPVRPDTTYTASFYAKGSGGFAGPVTASLILDQGNVTLIKAETSAITDAWKKYSVKLTTGHDAPTTAKARFVLSAAGKGSVTFSLVSLFPPTYQNTPNGLRPDLMKLMADMQPAFIRLPGGNYVEGSTFETRFNWKQMIGPVEQRPGHMGCWGYRSSDGFGMPEYLLWCKQLKAEPVLAVFAGYVLNGKHVDAGAPEMAQYTQEALEEIEYVSGPADSEWGKRRAADGFPEPFALNYVEIGNEDWFDKSGSYDARFTQMAKAIRQRYPKLKLIATAPVKSFKPDLYDDHFYRNARTLMNQANQYEKTAAPATRFNGGAWNGRQPDGIQTFVGEWATQEGKPTPTLNAALADAAFVMGLERNADTVPMECYAPLLVNVNPDDPAKGYPKGWQWGTNLIGYDALGSFGSPSYYAQVMLGQNKGDVVLPATLKVKTAVESAPPTPRGSIGVGTYHTQVEYKEIVVTTPNGRTLLTADLAKDTKAWQFTGGKWDVADQMIKYNATGSESWALTGDPTWTDYTIRVRARKIGGAEGFLILWHAADGANYNWWNIGGWGNTIARCESAEQGSREPYGPSTPVKIETGRWYDLRLEVSGHKVRGFIDDKLVTESTQQPRTTPAAVFASATRISASNTVIVKVVNTGANPVELAINLRGAATVAANGTATVLSGDPKAVNSVAEPTRISPRQEAVTGVSPSFRRTFPPHSFTVLRLSAPVK